MVGGAALALGLAACGSATAKAGPATTLRAPAISASGGAAPTPTSTSTSVTGSVTSTTVGSSTTTGTGASPANGSGASTTATTHPLGPACASDGLSVTAAPTDPGAGSISYVIRFTNSGSTPCTVAGFPGVSFAGAARTQVTPGASRTAQSYAPVTLAASQVASAVLRVAQAGNFPAATCKPVTVEGLRVIPPGETVPDLIQVTTQQACSASVNQTQIGPIQAGVATG